MLKDCPVMGTLPAQNLERARDFYERVLGLTPVDHWRDGSVIYMPGGTTIRVFTCLGKPSGDQTQLGFDVQGIRAVVRELEAKRVAFEDSGYMPDFPREGHLINIAPYNAAFFKDTEGNSLGIWEADSAPVDTKPVPLDDCTSEANLSAQEMRRARDFYERKFGFVAVEEFADGGVTYEAGGVQFIVSPTSGRPSGRHPQLAFIVPDLSEAVSEVSRLGIAIDDDDDDPTFADSEGNIISLSAASVQAGRPSR